MMQRVALVLAPGFQVMSFLALSVFEIANTVLSERRYEVLVLTERGAPVTSSFGMTVTAEPLEGGVFDTVLVSAGMDPSPPSPGLMAFLRRVAKTTRRVGSICVGAFALGEAGLLEGRHVTTHWALVRELQRRFPGAKVEEDRFLVEDDPIWTSAGMTAGMDLALAMVARDQGLEVARAVARTMGLERRRTAGPSQDSALLETGPKSDQIQDALTYARNHLGARLKVETLARAACLSPRQFARVFRAATGRTPAKAIESMRLDAARLLIEQTGRTIDSIAADTGFGDGERMRRAFQRVSHQSPQGLRSAARRDAP